MNISIQIRHLALCFGALDVLTILCVEQAQAAENPFTDQGNGTFKDNRTGLVWLSDPTKIPKPNSLAEAEAWVAKLKSGEQGLADGSKAGDWRLPKNSDWEAKDAGKRNFEIFSIGFPDSGDYSRGYVGTKSDDRGHLTQWQRGADSLSFASKREGYIWPVRSRSISQLAPFKTIDESTYRVDILDVWFRDSKQLIAYSTYSSEDKATLKVYDLMKEQVVLEEGGTLASGTFRNDGSLAYCDGKNVTIYDTEFSPDQTVPGLKLAMSPIATSQYAALSQEKLALMDSTGAIVIYKVDKSGFADPISYKIEDSQGGLAVSESEKWVAMSGGYESETTTIIDTGEGHVADLVASGSTGAYSPVFFANDRYVAFGGGYKDGRISVFRTSDWSLEKKIQAFNNYCWSVDASPDGQYLVAGGYDGIVKVYNTTRWNVVVESDIGFHVNTVRFAETMDYVVVGTGAGNPNTQKVVILKLE